MEWNGHLFKKRLDKDKAIYLLLFAGDDKTRQLSDTYDTILMNMLCRVDSATTTRSTRGDVHYVHFTSLMNRPDNSQTDHVQYS